MALTMAQVYAYARQAGFAPDTAIIATAIAMAESGDNPKARGDIGLETSYWGPSVGLEQIRTVKAQTGKGTDRDIARVGNDPLQNMIAAYDISNHGKDFTPWTTYTSGKYRSFLGQAKTAASGVGAASSGTVSATNAVFGLPSPAEIGSKVQEIGLVLLAVALAGGLVVAGGYKIAGSPKISKGDIGKAAELAAL
jgi:hypothetical protein